MDNVYFVTSDYTHCALYIISVLRLRWNRHTRHFVILSTAQKKEAQIYYILGNGFTLQKSLYENAAVGTTNSQVIGLRQKTIELRVDAAPTSQDLVELRNFWKHVEASMQWAGRDGCAR